MPRKQEVELSGQTEKEKPKPEEKKPEKTEDMDKDADRAPAPTEEIKDIVLAPPDDGPALDAASLSAIEAALNGEGAGGFGSAMSFESGGHIGGTGKGNAL